MQLISLSEAENLVADLDIGDFLESPTFDRKYLNVPESEFLPLILQKYCYLPTKLVKILFSLGMVQKKTKSKSNSAAISGFLCNKYYKQIISMLEGAENAYQLRSDQWSLMLRRECLCCRCVWRFFDFCETAKISCKVFKTSGLKTKRTVSKINTTSENYQINPLWRIRSAHN